MKSSLIIVCVAFCIQGFSSGAAFGQPEFTAVTQANGCIDLAGGQGRLFGAMPAGGLMVWDASNPDNFVQWTSSDGLIGDRIVDIEYSGSYLWAVSEETGLTRIDVGGETPDCRQFFPPGIASSDLTAVGATMVGETEVVLYGTDGMGVGLIIGGREGETYNALDHGLIDDTVTAITHFQDSWWIGTSAGISRFSNNVFTDAVDGLVSTNVRVLYAAGDTALYVGTTGGRTCRWNTDSESWDAHPVLPRSWINSLAMCDEGLLALSGPPESPDCDCLVDGTWEPRTLPVEETRVLLNVEGDLWAGGLFLAEGMSTAYGRPLLARLDAGAWTTWLGDGLLPTLVGGVGLAPDGRIWMGDYRGLGVSSVGDDGWFHIYETASAANDYEGHFGGGNILALATTPSGEVWFNQLGNGVVRFVPAAVSQTGVDMYDHLTAEETELSINLYSRILAHPDGQLLFLSADQAGTSYGVDVLLDTDDWDDGANWIHLPMGADGLHGGYIRGGVVARRDVIWFIVDSVGLVRWDINGEFAGPDDALTWDDQADDRWGTPVTSVSLKDVDLGATRAMLAMDDGTFWAGGSFGAVHFSYDEFFGTANQINAYTARDIGFGEGLLSDEVVGLAEDRNGDIWVACRDHGLNRIHHDGDDDEIDAWVNMETFLSNSLSNIYSSRIIAGLPGGRINSMCVDGDGSRLIVGSNNGAVIVDVPVASSGGNQPLSGLALYPNPFLPERGELYLGGIEAEVTYSGYDSHGGAAVEIFNVEGQLVYRDNHVPADEPFWDGNNMMGNAAASGMYLVKVVLGGQTKVCALALVR